MMNMLPLSYGTIYKTPDDHKPPDENELSENTGYPNLNSRDYAKRPLNHTVRMDEAWECISISTPHTDSHGNVAISCNKLSGREWTGTFWGFEKSDVIKTKAIANEPSKACFKLQCAAVINCMEFVAPNILLVAFTTGNLQVWSTHSEVRNAQNPYCLFLIGDKCEHMKPITCLTTYRTNEFKTASGCKEGAIKIWDMGGADLISTQSYRFAHTDSVTALASSTTHDNVFISCSLDKSCLLWDERETRPAIALYDNHNVRFKDVAWSLNNEDHIYVGDESGNVITLDARKPRDTLNTTQFHDRPVRKIKLNGEMFAVITDSNVVKVANCINQSILYENSDSNNFIRDAAWLSPTELLTVGFEGKLRSHCLDYV